MHRRLANLTSPEDTRGRKPDQVSRSSRRPLPTLTPGATFFPNPEQEATLGARPHP